MKMLRDQASPRARLRRLVDLQAGLLSSLLRQARPTHKRYPKVLVNLSSGWRLHRLHRGPRPDATVRRRRRKTYSRTRVCLYLKAGLILLARKMKMTSTVRAQTREVKHQDRQSSGGRRTLRKIWIPKAAWPMMILGTMIGTLSMSHRLSSHTLPLLPSLYNGHRRLVVKRNYRLSPAWDFVTALLIQPNLNPKTRMDR